MVVCVRDLKNRLSEYLRRVKRGERVVITDRGRPVAEIAPIEDAQLTPEQRLARLAEQGEITLGAHRGLARLRPARVRGRPVSETLLEDRDERR
jgi:prevent-host-death family protein